MPATRQANKSQHPGAVAKAKPRRTSAQVKADRAAAEAKKLDKKATRAKNIEKVAEFEDRDQMAEEMLQATPRPEFTPKPLRATSPDVQETTPEPSSDVDMGPGNGDSDNFIPKSTNGPEDSVADVCTDEEEVLPPPPRKSKPALTKAKVDGQKKAGKEKEKAVEPPKPKKPRVLREEISQAKTVSSSNKNVENNVGWIDADDIEWLKGGGFQTPAPKKSLIAAASMWGDKAKMKAKTGDDGTTKSSTNGRSEKDMDVALKQDGEGRESKVAEQEATAPPASKQKRSHQNVSNHLDASEDEVEVVNATERYVSSYHFHAQHVLMFTLDQTTLYYWNLSEITKKRKIGSVVNDWARTIPIAPKPASRAGTIKSGTMKSFKSSINKSAAGSRSASAIPSLSTSVTTARTAPSVLTNRVSILSQPKAPHVKVESQEHSIVYISDGGLSDVDETQGAEREAAVNSPPKGKFRATSSVS